MSWAGHRPNMPRSGCFTIRFGADSRQSRTSTCELGEIIPQANHYREAPEPLQAFSSWRLEASSLRLEALPSEGDLSKRSRGRQALGRRLRLKNIKRRQGVVLFEQLLGQ